MAKTTTGATVIKTEMLDRKMNEVFDWAKDNKLPIRDAIWNFTMKKNEQNTMKTADDVAWMLKASDDELKKFCEDNLKK